MNTLLNDVRDIVLPALARGLRQRQEERLPEEIILELPYPVAVRLHELLEASEEEDVFFDLLPAHRGFLAQVADRLRSGQQEYGGSSANRTFDGLLNEVLDELADVCGWSAIAAEKVEKLREKV